MSVHIRTCRCRYSTPSLARCVVLRATVPRSAGRVACTASTWRRAVSGRAVRPTNVNVTSHPGNRALHTPPWHPLPAPRASHTVLVPAVVQDRTQPLLRCSGAAAVAPRSIRSRGCDVTLTFVGRTARPDTARRQDFLRDTSLCEDTFRRSLKTYFFALY